MSACGHEATTPVEVRDRRDGGTTVVARICDDCLDELPAGWGCTDCSWVEGPRTLGTAVAPLLLVRPCRFHQPL